MKYPILSSVLALVASQAFLSPVSAAAAKSSSGGGSYTVKDGDTFAKIARAKGISLGELLKANRISNPDRITKGQKVVIPGSAAKSAPAKTTTAKTTTSKSSTPARTTASKKTVEKSPVVAKKEAVKRPDSKSAARSAADHATTVDVTPPAPSGTCVVQSGDTLFRIQRRTGVPVPTLLKLNHLTETSTLRAGQTLKLTASAKTAPAGKSSNSVTTGREIAKNPAPDDRVPAIIDQSRDASNSAGAQPVATGTAPHRVENGETFSSISRLYGISTTQLAAANRGVNATKLKSGQTLMIPGQPVRQQAKPLIVRADGRIMAQRPDPLGDTLPDDEVPAGRTRTGYLVEEGENIQQIAERFHTTEGVIRRLNRMSDSDNIYAGRYILVPFIKQNPAATPGENRIARRTNA